MTVANDPHCRFKPTSWALLVSVLLNLLLVGVLLGALPHVKHKPFGPMALASPHSEYLIDWMAHYLDPKDADAFRDSFKSQTDALKRAHDHMHRATADLADVFQQEKPDPAALQVALESLGKAQAEVNDAVAKILQDSYGKLSPDGRKRLADLTQNPM